MKIAFCLLRRPKSLNAQRTASYRSQVSEEAARRSAGKLFGAPLYSRVVWFHRNPHTQGDVDNILKPIHDALKGTVYHDDRAIVRTASFRINFSEDYAIDSDPDDPGGDSELLAHLATPDTDDILYIEIGEQSGQRVRLGPML